jgi:hypothetical protein
MEELKYVLVGGCLGNVMTSEGIYGYGVLNLDGENTHGIVQLGYAVAIRSYLSKNS